MWKWNRAEVPQVQHGSTVLPTAQGWKNAQLLWKVPKPRRSSRCWLALGYRLGCCRGSDLCSQYRAGLFFFFVFTRVLLSYRKKNCSAVWVFILASDFFFFLIWVFWGFFAPQVKPLFVICSCPTQPKVLGTPRTMSGFSKQHPNKKKGMESDVDHWHSPVSSHKLQLPFWKFPAMISEQSGQKTQK